MASVFDQYDPGNAPLQIIGDPLTLPSAPPLELPDPNLPAGQPVYQPTEPVQPKEAYGQNYNRLVEKKNQAGMVVDLSSMDMANNDILASHARQEAMQAKLDQLQATLAQPIPQRPVGQAPLSTGQLLALGLSALMGGSRNLPGQINQQSAQSQAQQDQAYQNQLMNYQLHRQDLEKLNEFIQKQLLGEQGNEQDLTKAKLGQQFQVNQQDRLFTQQKELLDKQTDKAIQLKRLDFDQSLSLQQNQQKFQATRDEILHRYEQQDAIDKTTSDAYRKFTDAIISPESEAQAKQAIAALSDPRFKDLPLPSPAVMEFAIRQGKEADDQAAAEAERDSRRLDILDKNASSAALRAEKYNTGGIGGSIPGNEPKAVTTARAAVEGARAKVNAIQAQLDDLQDQPGDDYFTKKKKQKDRSTLGNKLKAAKVELATKEAQFKARGGNPAPLSGPIKLKNGTIITPIN